MTGIRKVDQQHAPIEISASCAMPVTKRSWNATSKG